MENYKSIAIDGPCGAGKSTIAKQLAKKLGFIYVDTGALYRAIAFYITENNISPNNQSAIKNSLKNINIKLEYTNNSQKIILNNKDVTNNIRTPKISMVASTISAFNFVREFLFDLQQNMAKNNNVIMDGRDIGTVVLPNANLKIFLTASKKSRAIRRYKELLLTNNNNINFDDVYKELVERDKNDSSREIAPLKQANDAILVDSSNMDFNQTLNHIYKIITNTILK